ncbi:MAG: S8 family peptidase [bacterium]|nr:S8 family peptidase [bacterium]
MKKMLWISCWFIFVISLFSKDLPHEMQQQRYWIFFHEPILTLEQMRQQLQEAEKKLSPRAQQRRQRVRTLGNLADPNDLPLPQMYLDSLKSYGIVLYRQAKSIRAVSVYATQQQINWLRMRPWIRDIKKVAVGYPEEISQTFPNPAFPLLENRPYNTDETNWTEADYGYSYRQLANINLPPVHQRGYTGRGVLVGMLDAGFNRLTPAYGYYRHRIFDSLQIVATYDFVNNDTNVTNHGDQGDGRHGTQTLSCIAGYYLGSYIGAAPHVSVALAKTENTQYERRIEEDNWIAGLEWLDSLGCDIVSSSVSYRYFEDDSVGYPYRLRDGNTARVTIAADLMAQRGLLVANSMGNRGGTIEPWMSVPADGDTVLSVGAVNYDSTYAAFSSQGPTYDGRIKPEVVAPGVMVAVAATFSDTLIIYGSGTSFATPIIAGACATLLSANPNLAPMDLIRLLRQSAHQSTNPDTFLGWGIPNINRALDSALALTSVRKVKECLKEANLQSFEIVSHPNPFNPTVTLYFLPTHETRELLVFDVQGREVDRIQVFPNVSQINYTPKNLPSGNYFVRFPNSQVRKITYLR